MTLVAVFRRTLLLLALLVATPAFAQDAPSALVIANGGYPGALAVPGAAEDGALVAAGLRRAGFTVTTLNDAGDAALRAGIATFAGQAKGGSALIYYRGRAMADEARVASEGIDNWLIGTDATGPGGTALGDVLTALNGAGVTRQVLVIDAVAMPGNAALAEPAARSLRRAVIALTTGPAERSRFARAFADKLAQSNAAAAELLLGVADTVAGGGGAAAWVLNPNAVAAVAVSEVAAPAEPADVTRFNAAVACGSEQCLRDAMATAPGKWKTELAARIDQITLVDRFDPANPRAVLRTTARTGARADPATVARLSANRAGQYQLGLKYLRGDDGFPADDKEAYRWFEQAAAPGLAVERYDDPLKSDPYWMKSMFVLGWFYHTGRQPAAFSPEKAAEYWEKAARFYDIPNVDSDAAYHMAMYTDRCVAAANHCQPSRVKGLYEHAKSVGITRDRSPTEADFPSLLTGKN